MQKFTCLTCRVNLTSADAQREHYKHGWHIYNLKRKLSNLAPINEPEYVKVLEEHTEKPDGDGTPVSRYCDSCRKNFTSEKAFVQHNSSKKHLTTLESKTERKKRISESETVKIQDEEYVLIDEKTPVIEKPIEQVIEKPIEVQEPAGISGASGSSDTEMKVVDELAEEDEEIELESIPVTECLFCSYESVSMEANVEHMSKVHSFFIPDLDYCVDLEGMLTYLGMKIASGRACLYCSEFGKQFASKKSSQQHMLDKGHARIKFDYTDDCLEEYEDFYDYTASYPDGEGGDEEVDEDDMQIMADDYQLRLPNGNVLGHRSLLIYYRQNLRPQSEVRLSSNRQLVSKVMSQYQVLGWTGISSEGAKRRAKDIQHWQRQQHRARLHLGQAANKTSTLHFRCQTGFC